MSVVGKSTCLGFKIGLYTSNQGGNAVRYIKQRCYVLKDARISGYFDTKYTTVLWIEQIYTILKTKNLPIFFTPKQVNFRVTLVIYDTNKLDENSSAKPLD